MKRNNLQRFLALALVIVMVLALIVPIFGHASATEPEATATVLFTHDLHSTCSPLPMRAVVNSAATPG